MKKYMEQVEGGTRITVVLKNGEAYSEETYQNWKQVESLGKIPCVRFWVNRDVYLVYLLAGEFVRLPEVWESLESGGREAILNQLEEIFIEARSRGIPYENLMAEDQNLQVSPDGSVHVMCFPVQCHIEDLEKSYREPLERLNQERQKIKAGILAEGFVLRSLDTPVPVAFRIRQEEFIIGKSLDGTDGTVPEVLTVSRRHLAAGVVNGNAYIRDLSSTNGTFVNGVRLQPEMAVQIYPGDMVMLAEYSFRVEPLVAG